MSEATPAPAPRQKTSRIRFSPAISSREISPDRSSYFHGHDNSSGSGSGSESDDAKTSLLPKPVTWAARRGNYGDWWRENWANTRLVAALVVMSLVFGTIVWENSGGARESFFRSGLAKRFGQEIQDVFAFENDVLQHVVLTDGGLRHALCVSFLYA